MVKKTIEEIQAEVIRFEVITDGLTTRPRFSRRFAVVDNHRLVQVGLEALPAAVLETDDPRRASDYAYELNAVLTASGAIV